MDCNVNNVLFYAFLSYIFAFVKYAFANQTAWDQGPRERRSIVTFLTTAKKGRNYMKKRLLALLLTLGMVMTLLPVTAWAAGDEVTKVSTEADLVKAIRDGATKIQLQNSIALSKGLLVTQGNPVEIDLNEQTLTGADYTYVIRATNKAVLTVENGKIIAGELDEYEGDGWAWGVDNWGGTVALDNVEITADEATAVTANWDWDCVEGDEDNYTLGSEGQAGVTTLNNCVVHEPSDGIYAYNYTGNKIIINGGKIDCSVIAYGGTVELKSGEVQDIRNWDGTININGGTIHTINIDTFPLNIAPSAKDTVFSKVTSIKNDGCIPDTFDGKIILDDAYIGCGAELLGGRYEGTVETVNLMRSQLSFGATITLSDELVNSINEYLLTYYTGRKLTKEANQYAITTCETVTVKVQQSPNNICNTITVNRGTQAYQYGSQEITVNQGDQVTLYAANQVNKEYVFLGWYNGETKVGDNTTLTVSVDESATYTAKFEVDPTIKANKEAATAWLGDYDHTTEYTINSAQDMCSFAIAVNSMGKNFSGKKVTLNTDLDYTGLTYTPVGTTSSAFQGTFDGGGHMVSGITLSGYNIGVFGYSKGTIMNLNVKDSTFTGGSAVGGIVGEATGTVKNCTAKNVKVSGAYAGCIVGHTYGMTIQNVTVTGCEANDGAVVGYADSLTLTNATVSDFSGAGSALIGHCNAGTTVLTNINVNASEYDLIRTTYGSPTSITIKSEDGDTVINCSAIIASTGGASDTTEVKLESGNYTVTELLAEDSGESSITVTGGSYNVDISDYCDTNYGWVKNEDETYTVAKKQITPTVDTSENSTDTIKVSTNKAAAVEMNVTAVNDSVKAALASVSGNTDVNNFAVTSAKAATGQTGATMKVVLEEIGVDSDDSSATVNSITYDVKPVDKNGNEIKTEAESNGFEQDITFRLAVPFGNAGDQVKVTHEHAGTADEVGYYELQGNAGSLYVELSYKTFSKVTIEALAYAAPTAKSGLTYTGTAQALVKAGAVDTAGCEMVYSTTEDGTYTKDVPTGTNAGDYTVYYRVQSSDDQEVAITGTVAVHIEKATPTVTITSDRTTVTGRGAVTLTVTGIPTETTGTVTCNGVMITHNTDGTYFAILPNRTRTYTFTVNSVESTNYKAATAACTVSVEYYELPQVAAGTKPTNPETPADSDTTTETIEHEDGAVTVVETAKDGTVTTTYTAANGVKTVTVAEPGEAVRATVTLPEGVDQAVVVIPVTDITAGTVAVDTETGEIVKLSVPTQDGLAVRVEESVELTLKDNSKSFADVESDYWGADDIEFAVAHELFIGTSDTTFEPESPMTRQMVMTVLARLDGQDTDSGETWYEQGMAWAVACGISDGTEGTDNVTREQLVTMLYRYAGEPESEDSLGAFPDADQVSEYAQKAMSWAVANGVIKGDDGMLDPQGNATRAQVAAILQRYCGLLVQ
jgi:hypothetical protein